MNIATNSKFTENVPTKRGKEINIRFMSPQTKQKVLTLLFVWLEKVSKANSFFKIKVKKLSRLRVCQGILQGNKLNF